MFRRHVPQKVMSSIGDFGTEFAKIGPFQMSGFNVSYDRLLFFGLVITSSAMKFVLFLAYILVQCGICEICKTDRQTRQN